MIEKSSLRAKLAKKWFGSFRRASGKGPGASQARPESPQSAPRASQERPKAFPERPGEHAGSAQITKILPEGARKRFGHEFWLNLGWIRRNLGSICDQFWMDFGLTRGGFRFNFLFEFWLLCVLLGLGFHYTTEGSGLRRTKTHHA